MPDAVYGFAAKEVNRIARAVKAFERTPTNFVGGPSGSQDGEANAGCWAKIAASPTVVSGVNHYAWTEQRETTTGFDDMPSGQSGTTSDNFAINDDEFGGGGGAVAGTPVVWLRFTRVWDSGPSQWIRSNRFSRDNNLIQAKVTAITKNTAATPDVIFKIQIGHWDNPSGSSKGAWTDDSGGTDASAYFDNPRVGILVGDYVTVEVRGVDSGTTPPRTYYTITAGGRETSDAKIVADPTAINGAIRWKYTIQLGAWNMSSGASAGGTWGGSGSNTLIAFSSAESLNTFTGTGTIGTGNTNVKQSDGTIDSGNCALLPLPNGAFIVVRFRGYDTSTTPPTPYWTITNAMNSSQEVPDSSSSS